MTLGRRGEAAVAPRGLLPDERTIDAVASAVHAEGVARREALTRAWGSRTARALFARMQSVEPADDLAWAAGYGAILTDHLVAPIALADEDRREAVELGALANVIVFLHDNLADGGTPAALLLPPAALRLARSSRGRALLRAWAALAPAPARVLALLVAEWHERLDAHAPPALAEETRAQVARMYAAQLAILREGPRASDKTLREKCALPFVVMALPAWARAKDQEEREKHLAWVASVGELFGMVDDAVDVDEDAREGSPNLAARALREGAEDAWAQRAAELAREVRAAWRAPAGTRYAREVTEHAVAVCVASWLALADEDDARDQ